MKHLLILIALTLGQLGFASASGDVGNQAIKDGAIKNAEVASDAAIVYSKLSLAASLLSADMEPALQHYTDVTLTSAQVKALNATPITLVAAPGLLKAILVDAVYSTLTYVSAAYSTNAAGATLFYTDGSGTNTGITLTQAYLQSSATAQAYVRGAATSHSPTVNAAIVIKASTTDPTTGDSPIKIRTYYHTVALPLP